MSFLQLSSVSLLLAAFSSILFLFFASPSLLVQVFFLFESGEDRLAGETVIEVLAGGTGEPLIGFELTQLEGETAESGEDRLAGETVIEVLAGSTGEPLVGLELTPEGETAHDSDSKTD